jgi:hypothetical protein
MKIKPIATGFMAVWPTRKVVKVRIDHCRNVFPFIVSAVDPLERFEAFPIADPSLVQLYPSLKAALAGELEKLHEEYCKERRRLRTQTRRYKWALRQVEDYKHFEELQNPIFQG